MKNLIYLFIVLTFLLGCQPKQTSEKSTKPISVTLMMLWETDTLLATSESVLYDEMNKVLYVSCIGGTPPDTADGDGFMAKVSPEDGSIIELNWVTGLNAPKGMGLFEGKLYVTDIDKILEIDIASGEITDQFYVDGAKFLNDIDMDPNGSIYVTDSWTSSVHKISDGEVTLWMKDTTLGAPNGLFFDDNRMLMADWQFGTLHQIDLSNPLVNIVADSLINADGIERMGDGYIVSGWSGQVYYVSANWEIQQILDTEAAGSSAADIGFDSSNNVLYVPTFFGNQVVAYKVKIADE